MDEIEYVISNLHSLSYPRVFYKYRDTDMRKLEDIIVNNQLYFPYPKQLNDPFDCRVEFDFHGSDKKWEARIKKIIRGQNPSLPAAEVNKRWRNILRKKRYKSLASDFVASSNDNIGVLCLSSNPTRITMWSHYAECHKGVCLGFWHDKNDITFGTCLPVQYKDDYPLYKYVDIDTKDVVIELLTTKSSEWSNEEEWRVIAYPNSLGFHSGPGAHRYNGELLNEIIFGCRASEEFMESVLNLVSRANKQVSIYRANMMQNKYEIELQRIK